jgi:hypothetical protein
MPYTKKIIFYKRCDSPPRKCLEFYVDDQWEKQVNMIVDAMNVDNSELYYYEVMTRDE